MKKYYQYKTLKSAANAFVRETTPGALATKLTPHEESLPKFGEIKFAGNRKRSTGEYVPNAYLKNFGWKNTYYQPAITEVLIPMGWYLWFGWNI